MERYTGKHEKLGNYVTCMTETVMPETGEIVYVGPAAERLAEYEDIGLTPEQIMEVDKLYSEKCREVAELQRVIRSLQAAGMEVPDGKETQ